MDDKFVFLIKAHSGFVGLVRMNRNWSSNKLLLVEVIPFSIQKLIERLKKQAVLLCCAL